MELLEQRQDTEPNTNQESRETISRYSIFRAFADEVASLQDPDLDPELFFEAAVISDRIFTVVHLDQQLPSTFSALKEQNGSAKSRFQQTCPEYYNPIIQELCKLFVLRCLEYSSNFMRLAINSIQNGTLIYTEEDQPSLFKTSLFERLEVLDEELTLERTHTLLAEVIDEIETYTARFRFSAAGEDIENRLDQEKQRIEEDLVWLTMTKEFVNDCKSVQELLDFMNSLGEEFNTYEHVKLLQIGLATKCLSDMTDTAGSVLEIVREMLRIRFELTFADTTLETPIVRHLPQRDIGSVYLTLDRIGLVGLGDIEREIVENGNGINRVRQMKIRLASVLFICIEARENLALALEDQRSQGVPILQATFDRAVLAYNTLNPFVTTLQKGLPERYNDINKKIYSHLVSANGLLELACETFSLYPGSQRLFDPIVSGLAEYTGRPLREIQAIFSRGLRHTVLQLFWKPYLGIPAENIIDDYGLFISELERRSQEEILQLNYSLIEFLLTKFQKTVENGFILKGRSLFNRGSIPPSYQPSKEPLLSMSRERLLEEMIHSSRTVKGDLPSLWKMLGLRFYDTKIRLLYTSQTALNFLIKHSSESLRSRIRNIREETEGGYVSDGVTLTTILPVEFAFVNGFYALRPRYEKETDELHPWVYEFAEYLEKTSHFRVLAIDYEFAGRKDLPHLFFILWDGEKVIEWRIFRWAERKIINRTHTDFKHSVETTLYLLGLGIALVAPPGSRAVLYNPDTETYTIRLYRKHGNAVTVRIHTHTPNRSPTNLDIANSLGVLGEYLARKPNTDHMAKKVDPRSSSHPLHPLDTIDYEVQELSLNGLLQAVNASITDLTNIRENIRSRFEINDLSLFFLLLHLAGVKDSYGNRIPAARLDSNVTSLSSKQTAEVDNILTQFFQGFISLTDLQNIAENRNIKEIIAYIVRTLT